MFRVFFFSLLMLLLSQIASTETIANPSSSDSRTRTVNYDSMQVYKIVGYYGYLTRIEFAEYETDIKFALGDEEAWTVVTVDNNLLIKPSQAKPDTNMTIITNKRNYNFVLSAEEIPEESTKTDAPHGKEQQFLIVFKYPREAAQVAAEKRRQKEQEYAERRKQEEEKLQREIEKYRIDKALEIADNEVVNINYYGCGSEEVLPVAVYDNNQFTFMKFAAGTTIPSFFTRNSMNEESLVNYNIDKDWIVIQRTFKELILRNSQYVGCLINASQDTTRTKTGTVSPRVHRNLKLEGDN